MAHTCNRSTDSSGRSTVVHQVYEARYPSQRNRSHLEYQRPLPDWRRGRNPHHALDCRQMGAKMGLRRSVYASDHKWCSHDRLCQHRKSNQSEGSASGELLTMLALL